MSLHKRHPQCEDDCDQILTMGRYAHAFNPDAELDVVSRYRDRSFALVSQEHVKANGKSSSRTDYHFVSGAHDQIRVDRALCTGAQAKGFSARGELLCLEDESLKIYTPSSEHEIKLPAESTFGAINNNLAGTVAIAFVNADKRMMYYANLHDLLAQGNSAWQSMPTRLHNRSDSRDVIAVYPVNRKKGEVALYEYINPFNKGLTLYSFAGDQSKRHVLTNESMGHIGFAPEVFVSNNQYVVTAKDSRDASLKSYVIAPESLQQEDQYHNDESSQSQLDFMAGYGLTYNNWEASQSVGGDVDTEYDIEPSLMHSLYFQARYADTQVSLKYLTNQAKETGNAGTSNAVSMLTGLVDFNQFFKGADTLRLKIDWTQTDGVATYKADRADLCLAEGCKVSKNFSTEYMNVETLVMSDGGVYMGLRYSNFAMPSAVGFTRNKDSDHVLGAAFDEDYEQSRLMFVLGSDEAAYGARYETDYSRFFLRPNLGLGVVQHKISDAAEKAARNGETGDIAGEYGMIVSGGLDLGYTYQRRWLEARGLGFSVQTGVRAHVDWMTNSPFGDAKDDEIYFNSDRFDLMWGPYIQFNAIF
ncbi:hypothetical protein [Vibrio stylophorae]|uniref:hypothetical protein n=1 Tax=Vibrio stylophorae TaxID=659351 RepID=UPI001F3C84E4|nr:hypothetical protein [Vibrio stylophorae]